MHHLTLNARINNIAGNRPLDRPAEVIAAAQAKVILSELRELIAGIRADDRTEIRDGIADVLVTVDGMIHRLDLSNEYLSLFDTSLGESVEDELSMLDASVTTLGACQNLISLLEDYENLLESIIAHPAGWACHNTRDNQNADMFGLAVMAYVCARLYDVNVYDDQLEVYRSNLSKFDTMREDAEAGIAKYASMGVTLVIEESEVDGVTYYVLKSPEDQVVGGKDYPKGKFLKSIHFSEPNLS